MEKTYEMTIAGLTRKIPIQQIDEDLARGLFIGFGDVELVTAAASALLKKLPDFDVIVTEEVQGIPLAFEMTRQAGLARLIVVRKTIKSYMGDSVAIEVSDEESTRVKRLYMSQSDVDYIRNQRVLLIDDVIFYGSTMRALDQLVEAMGGMVVGYGAIATQGAAHGLSELVSLVEIPMFQRENGTWLPS